MKEKRLKILGISSGRVMGNAEVMLRECLMECERLADVDAHIVRLRTLKIKECDGCLECMKDAAGNGDGKCVIQDDFEWLKEQVLWADAIVFSDPCFTYMPTAETITLMNRAMGCGRKCKEMVREGHKLLAMICVGGSDTVDFSLPLQQAVMNAFCPGNELADQFYANWIRGKGYIADQPWLLERARLQAKRLVNKWKGYHIPEIKTAIRKLNPLEYKDDVFYDLEPCPVCHQSVVQMKDAVTETGKYRCAVCGATGHVEHHGGKLTYVWDDDTVAHNSTRAEHDEKILQNYISAHSKKEGSAVSVKEFPVISPENDLSMEKSRITAVVAGTHGGTSELLARKALETATASGEYEGVIIRINDLNIRFCTGCLICKVNARYRGGIDECILKDDDLWLVDRLLESSGIIWSFDSVGGFTYGKIINFLQRFGHFHRTMKPQMPKPYATIISGFDDEIENAVYPTVFLARFFTGHGPRIANELFKNVSLTGDGILSDENAMKRAGQIGEKMQNAVSLIRQNPAFTPLVQKVNGVCPSCGLDLIELHDDMTVSCVLCDATGRWERRFGMNNIIWDPYDRYHSRTSMFGAVLHDQHIGFSQAEDRDVLDNPKITAEMLKPYTDYGKVVKPERR